MKINYLHYAYCVEDPSLIENYEAAAKDNFKGWVCHHRMETHRRNGKPRITRLSQQDLIEWNIYFHRPASELIFMTVKDHNHLHRYGQPKRVFSEQARKNISEAKKGKPRKPHSEETKRKISEARKAYWTPERRTQLSNTMKGNARCLGHKHSEETKRKMSETAKRNHREER